jgi:DNA-binding IclR family transcriptional regulator
MVQSVQRAVRVLRELAAGGPRLGVTELAERVGVAKPTVHALLRTLEGEGLVVQDSETGRYQLGPGLLLLGNAYLDTQELRARSLSWADTLAPGPTRPYG